MWLNVSKSLFNFTLILFTQETFKITDTSVQTKDWFIHVMNASSVLV